MGGVVTGVNEGKREGGREGGREGTHLAQGRSGRRQSG